MHNLMNTRRADYQPCNATAREQHCKRA